ncbi:phosphoribosyltransferase family protein [Hufsiella ginkgonis]|uniref:Uncharacterized protein n=1 Tax=Hufsiella ginkgonis TaxID=2695274 RepID=A0A7K1XVE3_9SPHI|nr:phosphoribosyltransferase family protein [Hufsiella ginkgonis]MXV14973.1 hypothetical protein [Hufsiella ginkgonis]
MNHSYSLHKITDASNFAFCPDAYSRFKFGDSAVAESFGIALAEGFIREVLQQSPIRTQVVVISSPYAFIPTATFAMKDHFVYRLNRWLADHHLPIVQETKVHRTITYKEDYGALNAEERLRLIGNDSFHVDKHFLEGKTLIFLDDIKITGSHERMIMKMVSEYQLDNEIYMLYFAELINSEIHPNVENTLNYHEVRRIFDLERIIDSGRFCFNTRVVKYILNYEPSGFHLFLEGQTDQFINQLYNMALGNGYHTIEAYAANLNYIKDYLFSTNNKLIEYGN